MTDWPKIKARRTTRVSPWMEIIEREVEFTPGAKPELYHAVAQQDYIAIVARTPDGQIPIVRQYRPALERFTWELPAGLVDKSESPRALLPSRTAGGDRFSRAQRACAWQLCAMYVTTIESHAFVLCRDWAAPRS